MNKKSAACIIVNYRSPYEMLKQSLDSAAGSAGVDCRIILVDNCSGDGAIELVREDYPDVKIIELTENAGFAAGVNRGLEAVREPYVMLLNPDAALADTALSLMVDVLEGAGDNCAGVAPMMMSSAHKGVIDAIGTVMPRDGASFNRGIGQCNLGQYDHTEEVFGTCFGATLLRRKLFEPGAVGPLYEKYFLYFEDSDWCMRARSQGYRFLTVPDAIVYHLHSGVTRNESLSFKYRLIELNTLKIVVRTFDSPLLAAKIVISRCTRLLARTLIRRRFITENLTTLASFLAALPEIVQERRELKTRRIVSDSNIFGMAAGEEAFFDTVNYRPTRCLDSLAATYARLLRHPGKPAADVLLKALGGWRNASGPKREELAERLRQFFADEPECAQGLLMLALEETTIENKIFKV